MAPWLISLIAVVSIGLCIFLWFRDVRRVMRERASTVESAAGYLAEYQERARKARGDPEAEAVLERSKTICQQAVDLYNRELQKLWNRLPARLMGYHRIQNTQRPAVRHQKAKTEHHHTKRHVS